MELQNAVAIITGGARGIGRGIAYELAKEGVRIAVADLPSVDADRRETIDEILRRPLAQKLVPPERRRHTIHLTTGEGGAHTLLLRHLFRFRDHVSPRFIVNLSIDVSPQRTSIR